MLDLFGQGDKAGLVFVVDAADNKSPTTFFYPEYYCNPNHQGDDGNVDAVGEYCASLPREEQHATSFADQVHPPDNWFESLLQWTPDGDLQIVPVSIILACTALQSIMLFVGLFAGTPASWQRRLKASLIVGVIVYVLNLVRNTGIIWFYGQGHASFWVMHNAIGKGGSLLAMIGIAFAVFKWFPEFFKALVGVLDLPDRDGPIERTLKIGRRRPAAAPPPPTPPGS
jgi:exosortase/archaeosortase family protein